MKGDGVMRRQRATHSLNVLAQSTLFTLFALWALATSLPSCAQIYPTRPIRFIMPGAAGSSPDITARLIAAKLTESLGQAVLVENRGSATGIVGGEFVAKSAPDGYTFLYPVNSIICANPHLYSKLPYDALKSFVPVTQTVRFGYVMLGRAGSPVTDLRGLIAAAKAEPSKLNYGSGGLGVGNHVSMELFLELTGTKMTHIPHRDSAVSVSSSETDVALVPYTTGVPLARAGKLRPLGVTLDKRLAALPDVPAISETVPGYIADAWHGVFAPAGTPGPIVERVATEVARVLQQPDLRKRLIDLGLEPIGSTPVEFAQAVAADHDKWGQVIRKAGIKLD